MHIHNIDILTALPHFYLSEITLDYRVITKIFFSAVERLNKGVRREISCAIKYFSKSENVRSLVNIFQEAVSYIPFLPRGDKPILQGFDLLENEVVAENSLMNFELKSLSKLKKEKSESDLPVSKEAILSLYGPGKKAAQDVKSLFSILGSFTEKKLGVNPFSSLYQEGFSKGLERKETQKKWISDNELLENRNEELAFKACEWVNEIGELKNGQSFVYFGEMTSNKGSSSSFLDEQFKKYLGDEIYQLFQGNDKALSERLKSYVLNDLKERKLLNAESNKTGAEEKLEQICNRTKNTICTLLPESWYEAIASSLKQDMNELLFNPKNKNRSQFAEQLWNKMVEKGFLQTVDMAIEQSVSSAQSLVQQTLETVKEKVSSTIPKTALDLMSICGIELSPNESFSIEIKREDNDNDENKKFCLKFFSNRLGTVIHPTVALDGKEGGHLPLVFRNIDAKKLDQNFFGLLLSYEAWPKWKLGVSFSLSNVCEQILGLLETKPEDPETETIYPDLSSFSGEPLDWLKLHLYHQAGSKSKDFVKFLHYDLPYQFLIDFWPEVQQHPELLTENSVRYALQSLVGRLSEKGIEFYQKKKIDTNEFKSLYATLKEVKKALGVHETTIPVHNKKLSVLIPNELRSSLEAMAERLSLTPSRYEAIKQAFVEIVGEDAEEEVEQILQDILPDLAKREGLDIADDEISWGDIFNFDHVKKFVADAIPARISLLHAYRTYAKISSGIMVFLGFSTKVYFMEKFIKSVCPQIAKHIPYSINAVAKMAVYFGPPIFKKMIPQKLFVIISALISLVNEIMGYIVKRIGLHIVRAVICYILGSNNIAALTSAVKGLSPRLLREGEISYDLPNNLSARQLIVLPPAKMEFLSRIKKKGSDKESLKIPRPHKVTITSENLRPFLSQLNYETAVVKNHLGKRPASVYLHAQIRQLPLPNEKEGDLWDKVENPEAVMELFHLLLQRSHNMNIRLDLSPDETAELITSAYTLYAIIDKLARRCPNAHLDENLKANGVNLARWMSNPVIKISNCKTYEKLKLLARYFDLEPFKKYTEEELNHYQKKRLFDYDRNTFWIFSQIKNRSALYKDPELNISGYYLDRNFFLNMGSLMKSTDGAYYRRLLQDREIQKKIKVLGVTKKTPEQHQLALLFQDLSLNHTLVYHDCITQEQKNEQVEKKLSGNTEDHDDYQPEQRQKERILLEKKLSKNTSSLDNRKGILPRPFHHLRLVHLICGQIDRSTEEKPQEPSTKKSDCYITNQGLNIAVTKICFRTEEKVEDYFINNRPKRKPFDNEEFEKIRHALNKISDVGSEVITWATRSYFTNYYFRSNLDFSEFEQDIKRKIVQRRVTSSRGGDLLFRSNLDSSMLLTDPKTAIIEKPSENSQSKIMIKKKSFSPFSWDVFTQEQARIFHMINTHKADQLIRALGLFSSKELLTQGQFRSLFELLVTELKAIDAQFLQEAGVAKDIGRFFNEMLDHFHTVDDWETSLYLTRVGSYLLQHCQRYDPKSAEYFPNFPDFIENKIAAVFRKKDPLYRSTYDFKDQLILSYLYLVSSYHPSDPETAPESQKKVVIKAIARLKYTLVDCPWADKEWDVAIKCSEMLYLWEPYIEEAMREDVKLREEVLNGILADIGVDTNNIPGEWQGEYPDLIKGEYHIQCGVKKENAEFIWDLRKKVYQTCGVKLTNPFQNSSNMILFPQEGWEITFSKEQKDKNHVYTFEYRILLEDKKWRYLNSRYLIENKISLLKGDSLFLEENSENPTILQIRAGKEIARHKMRRNPETTCFELVESVGEIDQQLSTEERGDGFELLNWFQPPSATKLFYSPTALGPKLKKIEFNEVKLAYEIQTLNGLKQAVCSDQKTPGFYIAKKQGDDRLKAYPNYLLLENEAQEKKVHLIEKPVKELLGLSLLKGSIGLSSTPAIEKMMKGAINNDSFKGGNLYTYSLNKKGKLESSEPKAILYLVMFHWARGDFREASDYLTMLEDCSRQAPFSDQVLGSLSYWTMPLLVSQTREAEEMYLRLMALREENRSLQNKTVDTFEYSTVLRWVTIQMKYNSYLQKIESGAHPYLSTHQEVFILKALSTLNALAIQQGVEKVSDKYKKNFERLGIGSLIERLIMLPIIKNRYHELRKLDGEAFSWKEKSEEVLFETFFGKNKPSIPSIPSFSGLISKLSSTASKVPLVSKVIRAQSQEKGMVPALVAYFKQGSEYSFNTKQPMKHEVFSKCDEEKVSTKLFDLTPEAIKKNFFYFYRLAMQKMPKSWEIQETKKPTKNQHILNYRRRLLTIKKKRFLNQAEEFRHYFPLLKGKFDDPAVNQMMAILQMVLEKRKGDKFIKPDRLEMLFSSYKYIFEEQIALLVKKASSWSRWASRVIRPFKVQSNESLSQLKWRVNNKAVDYGIGPIMILSSWTRPWLNLGIKLFHSVYTVLKQDWQIHNKKIEKEKLLVEANNIDKKLPEDCEKAMTQRDSAIDKTMNEIFEEYFEEHFEENPYQECLINGKVHYSNRKKMVEKSDKIDLSIYDDFPDLKQSLEDYYKPSSVIQGIFKLKKGKELKPLWNKLVRLRNEIDQFLSKERQYAKDFVRSQLLANRDLISKMRGDKIPVVSFKEIDNLFIQENDKELIERFRIPSEKLPHLKQRLYLYHVMASRWNLLFEKMAELKEPTDKAIPLIAEELQRRRVYDFKGVPERLVRGKVVFESRTGKMLWDKQSSQIDRMLLNPENRQVVELIMGSGKSWYGIPEIGYFSGFVINIWPTAVAKTTIPLIFRQARKIFNQAASALQISRSIIWVRDNSWALYQIFQRALQHREQINMTKEDLQSSELCYIEKGIAFAKNKTNDLKEVGENFWKVLKRVRYDSQGCIDEAHKQFDRRKELNYPLGEKKRLEIKYVEVMTKALYELISDEEFSNILTIKSEKPSPLSEKEYKDKIQKKFAEKLAASFDFKEQELKEVVVYLCGQADSIPQCVLESIKCQEIALVKGLLTVFIPEALERTIHVDFNPSKKGNGEYVRPSEGNDNPLEEAIIQSPFEAYVKTAFQLLHDRLKDEQLQKLIEDLKKKAKSRAGRGDPEATLEGLFFQEQCPGYKLFSFKENDRAEVYKILRKSDQAVLLYLKNFIAKDIRYSERRLSSNSSNFGSMFRKFYSDTGTPYNKGSYLPGTQVLHDPGTDGESIHMMSRQSEPTRILKNEAPRQVLEELIGFCDEDPMIRAIIDRGAVLNGISSDDVAKRLLEYITAKRPEMKGVAFYQDGELMMLERGASKAIPAHQSKIKEEERFTYFPEPQTYAADVPQVKGAKGIITVASTTCSNEWFQAGYRMRGLEKKNQKLIPVMTERTRKSIVKDVTIPNIHEINLFTKENEERQQMEDNYQADRQKMHDVVRRAILDKSLEAKTFEEATAILARFEDFLITKVQDDPFVLFGHIDTQVEPEKIFDLLRERYLDMIKKEKLFTKQDSERIEKELNQIGRGKYPDKVHSYKVEGELEVHKLDDINKQAQLQSDDQEESNLQDRAQNQMQLQIQRMENNQLEKGREQDFYAWPEKLNPTALDWLEDLSVDSKKQSSMFSFFSKIKSVSLYSLSKLLQNNKIKERQEIGKQISSRLLISRNMLYEDFSRPLEAFGPYQIPVFEVLVIKKREEEPSFVIINQKEADYWRKKLEEDRQGKHESDPSVKIGLYDPTVTKSSMVVQGKNEFSEKELAETSFRRIVVQLKFLRGDVNYEEEEREILKRWLKKSPKSMDFFHEVHQYHATAPIEGSSLSKILIEIDPKRKENWIKI